MLHLQSAMVSISSVMKNEWRMPVYVGTYVYIWYPVRMCKYGKCDEDKCANSLLSVVCVGIVYV